MTAPPPALAGRGLRRAGGGIVSYLASAVVATVAWLGLYLTGLPDLGEVFIGSAVLFVLAVAMALLIALVELKEYAYPEG